MTEAEVKGRLRRALDKVRHPRRSETVLEVRQSLPRSPQRANIPGAVAMFLMLLVLLMLFEPRVAGDYYAWQAARPAVANRPYLPRPLPKADLDAAGLATVTDLVATPDLSVTSAGYMLTLIGLYADSAETIAIFHEDPDGGFPEGSVSDGEGPLTSAGGLASAARGDWVVRTFSGPRPAQDGTSRLRIWIGDLWDLHRGVIRGKWIFDAAVDVQPGERLTQRPVASAHYGVTSVTVEMTPAVIHLQALVNAAPANFGMPLFRLVGVDGQVVGTLADIEGPASKPELLTGPSGAPTHVYELWRRSPGVGAYTLWVQGGESPLLTLQLPALVSEEQR